MCLVSLLTRKPKLSGGGFDGGFGGGIGGGGSGGMGGGGFGCIGGSLGMNPSTMLEQAQQMMGGRGFGGMGGGFGGGGFGGGAASWAAAALATKRLLPLPGVPQCAYRDSSVPPRTSPCLGREDVGQ